MKVKNCKTYIKSVLFLFHLRQKSSRYIFLHWTCYSTTMSFVDFSQRAEDHTKILILVHQISSAMKQKNFNKIYERIARLHTITIAMAPPRVVRMRYRKYYAMENNSWGDFQVHRRVLGLLSVAQSENESDLVEILRQHEQQKVHFLCCFLT
jgi:hypothetical protein